MYYSNAEVTIQATASQNILSMLDLGENDRFQHSIM